MSSNNCILQQNFKLTCYRIAINYQNNFFLFVDDLLDVYSDYDIEQYPTGDDIAEEQDSVLSSPSNTYSPSFIPPYESDPMEGVDVGQFGIRPCDRKVDLYVLQPDKLNTSGQGNPLKGKLTNCHSSGCER